MNQWMKVDEELPPCFDKDRNISVCVFVTDGILIEIARYVYKPRNYGCAVDDDEQKATCGPQPHWHFEGEGAFKEGDRCFGSIETFDVTHWMTLPKPPRTTVTIPQSQLYTLSEKTK
jgi:hypothetical protein